MKPTRSMRPSGDLFRNVPDLSATTNICCRIARSSIPENPYHYLREGRFLLHAFIVMPDHAHLLLTPSTRMPHPKLRSKPSSAKAAVKFARDNEDSLKWGEEDIAYFDDARGSSRSTRTAMRSKAPTPNRLIRLHRRKLGGLT